MLTNIITAAQVTLANIAPETLTDEQAALIEGLMLECQFALQEREVVTIQHSTECELEKMRIIAESDMHDALLAHTHGWHE
jgi:hypothetical protein